MDKEFKQLTIERLRERFGGMREMVAAVEPRLAEYYEHLCEHSTTEDDDPNDMHNCYELLGALKLLRLMTQYVVDREALHDVIYKYEGRWQQVGKRWRHVSGGVRHPGTTGPTYYRLQPFQVFVLTSIFGLRAWVATGNEAGTRDLLPTEEERDGMIYDLRRLCTEFTLYTPRKTAKTQLSAFIQFWFFMNADANAECYCCANASDQAKILFGRTKSLIHQLDPTEQRIRFTAQTVNWKENQFRAASLTALSAGGKTKDGMFAQLCSADEFGSAGYVNGVSDMGKLVSVIESSMGPRREPLTFISTTAGIVQAGPFIDKLNGIHAMLKEEVEREPTDSHHTLADIEDRHMCLLLEPDEWEREDEYLLTSKTVRRKVNPMLGIVVQHAFYDEEVSKARTQGPEKLQDVISKDFNVYRSTRTTKWIAPEEIYPLMTPRRIDQCTAADGWVVFVGMDFSKGDDLHAVTYLAARSNRRGGIELFADMDSWMCEKAIEDSSFRAMLEQWVADGHLHVSPGRVLQPSLPVDRIHELFLKGVRFAAFGYDYNQSQDPINSLKSMLYTDMGVTKPEAYVKPVSQTYATFNPAVLAIEQSIRTDPPLLSLSDNPLWPWEFGNCMVDEDTRMNNRKMIKANSSDSCKVDNIQCLGTAFLLEINFEGTAQDET